MSHWEEIAAERRALAGLLGTLTADQWNTPSLCEGWTVRHVAAHLVVLTGGMRRVLPAVIAAGGDIGKASMALALSEATRGTEELIDGLRRGAGSHFRPPGLGSQAPLTDILAHTQDIMIPLGLADDRPVQRWQPALEFLLTPKARIGFVSGALPPLRYVATDLDWRRGRGDEVRGPAAALALAMLGRRARLDDLGGPGAQALCRWVHA